MSLEEEQVKKGEDIQMDDNKKVVVAMSGGLDSTVLVATLIHRGYDVIGVTFKYGSKHNPYELKAVNDVITYYRKKYSPKQFTIYQEDPINLTNIFAGIDSPFFAGNSKNIPTGEYTKENMNDTVVPARNIIFISILASIAERLGCKYVAVGVHANDSTVYKDCTLKFITAMNAAIQSGTNHSVTLLAPYVNLTKKSIVHDGKLLGAPMHLTRSCYESGEYSCGKCATCVDRLRAFYENNMVDPITYTYDTDSDTEILKDELGYKYIQAKQTNDSCFVSNNSNPYTPYIVNPNAVKIAGEAYVRYYLNPIIYYTNSKHINDKYTTTATRKKETKIPQTMCIIVDGQKFTRDKSELEPFQHYEIFDVDELERKIGMYISSLNQFIIIKVGHGDVTEDNSDAHVDTKNIFWRKLDDRF